MMVVVVRLMMMMIMITIMTVNINNNINDHLCLQKMTLSKLPPTTNRHRRKPWQQQMMQNWKAIDYLEMGSMKRHYHDLALQVAPDMPAYVETRSICHANRALCFLKLGKYEDTIKDCMKALELNPNYLKALLRRGEAHEKLEHFEEAIADLKKVLELDQSDVQARRTIQRLEPLAAEKRERMKQEMIEKTTYSPRHSNQNSYSPRLQSLSA